MKKNLSIWAQQMRMAYAEHLIRCNDPNPEDMEELLSLDGDHEQARRWLAFGHAKRRHDPDHIRGLLAYLISQYYPVPFEEPLRREFLLKAIRQKKLGISDMTVEKLCGTYLNWNEIFHLIGKQFNPTRVKEHVRAAYAELMGKSTSKE